MDFKSRFEGRKAFINKAGNIADAQTRQVLVLKKPGVSRNAESSAVAHNISFGDKSDAQDLQVSVDGQKSANDSHKARAYAGTISRH